MTLESEVNVFPGAPALLAQLEVVLFVALSLQFHNLKLLLHGCDFLGAQLPKLGAEGHEGACAFRRGEDDALELFTTLSVGEGSNLHARALGLCEGDERPGVDDGRLGVCH